jgi:hypothetical protein
MPGVAAAAAHSVVEVHLLDFHLRRDLFVRRTVVCAFLWPRCDMGSSPIRKTAPQRTPRDRARCAALGVGTPTTRGRVVRFV